jgi:hypothetical protein
MFGTPGQSGAAQIGNGFAAAGLVSPPAKTGSSSVSANPNTYAFNGQSYNAAGDPSSTPVTSAVNYNNGSGGAGGTNTPVSGSGGSTGSINMYGLTSSSPNWYQLQNGETTANYNARTQDGIASPVSAAPAVNTSGTSAGSGMGGGQAPAGYQYDASGKIVPLDNTQTVNSNGQNAPISSNVATGGGTQTNFPSIVGGLASTAATSSPPKRILN